MRLSLIAPAYNEEESINAFIQAVEDVNRSVPGTVDELIIIDDGSEDSTYQAVEECRKFSSISIRLIKHDENKGILEAWITGVHHASHSVVCFIDSDLQNDPNDIVRMKVEISRNQGHMVQAVRSSIGRARDIRMVYSRALNLMLNLLFGRHSSDSKSGYFMINRNDAMLILEGLRNIKYPQTYVGAASHLRGISITQVDSLFLERHAGTSFLKGKEVRTILGLLLSLPKSFWKLRSSIRRDRYRIEVHNFGDRFISNSASERFTERFLKRVYFSSIRLHTWNLTTKVEKRYRSLKQSEFATADAIEVIQRRRLIEMLRHASANVPFYEARFRDFDFNAPEIDALEILARLPLLSKSDVRKNIHFDLFARGTDQKLLHRIATSGSTGEPFVTYADRNQLEERFAATLRAQEMTGWRFGKPQMRLWHQTLGMTKRQVVKERLDAFLLRRTFIRAFEMTDAAVAEMVDEIERRKPYLIDGYAESLNFLASWISKGNKIAHNPTAVMSSAQVLPQQSRDAIEKAFGATVFDKYGAREFSGIAYECQMNNGHHVVAESYIVELLKDGRPALPGEVGEVVITDLANFSVPLIRYRIGDLAVALDNSELCGCGRSHPRIGRIEGRTQAIVHCGNGVYQPGAFFLHFFKDLDDIIRHFQVVQETVGSFILKIVPGEKFSEEGLSLALKDLREYVGSEEETEIAVEIVAEIPLLKTGKRTAVVSHLQFDYQQI